MKTKKFLSMFLVLAMVFSLAACGNNSDGTDPTATPTPGTGTTNPTNAPDGDEDPGIEVPVDNREASDLASIIPDKTLNLTVYTQLANFSGEMIGWFAQVMLEKFNVKITIINEAEGTFSTRMAGGNLGDIVIFGNDTDSYLQAVDAGMLLDWEEDDLLADYGPYINATMQRALEKNKNLSRGSIYGFGHNVGTSTTEHESFFYYPDLRWDLYTKIGRPQIKTLEDYVDVLEQMVAIEPTNETGGKTYGVSMFKDWDGDMVMFVKATAALYGYDEFGIGLYNVNTQTYEDCLKDGGMYLRCLKFYNTLYQKGLLNPDSMTQTFGDVSEAYQNGTAFFNIFSWMGGGAYNTMEHTAAGKAMYAVPADDFKNITYGLNVNGGNRVWTIGAKTDYPELCMAIINWLSTPEGKMITDHGPKGLCWDYDADSNPYITELGMSYKKDGKKQMTGGYTGTYEDGTNKMNNTTWAADAVNPDANGATYNHEFWDSTLAGEIPQVQQDWRDYTGYTSPDEYLEATGRISIAIGTSYSASTKSDELMTTWNQVIECIKNGSWSAIYAKTDAEFDTIVKDMRDKAIAYGYDQCVAFQQEEAVRRAELENAVK